MRFLCTTYPEFKVLIERGNGAMGGDLYAQFHQGSFETDDPETIKVLRRTPFVHADQEIDPNRVAISVRDAEGNDRVIQISGKSARSKKKSGKLARSKRAAGGSNDAAKVE